MIFLLYEEAVANRSARASGGTVTRRSGDAEEINAAGSTAGRHQTSALESGSLA